MPRGPWKLLLHGERLNTAHNMEALFSPGGGRACTLYGGAILLWWRIYIQCLIQRRYFLTRDGVQCPLMVALCTLNVEKLLSSRG